MTNKEALAKVRLFQKAMAAEGFLVHIDDVTRFDDMLPEVTEV